MLCPVCSESAAAPLSVIEEMPLIGCQFADSREDAFRAPRGRLDLVLCKACGHIYNRAFEAERIRYAPGYENALGFSPRHRALSDATVERLLHSYSLCRKLVVEIGCGTADFLSLLCAKGGNFGLGYDPSQVSRLFQVGDGSVAIVGKSFDTDDKQPVDVVCSRHVLEHLADLRSTLHQARAVLKDGGIAYFQVPNGLTIFRDLDIWDLTYEHVSYFSPASLQRALSDAQFAVLRLETSFGEQYLDVEAVANGMSAPPPLPAGYADCCDSFAEAFARIVSLWKDRVASMIERGRRIVLWGGGTKAVSFLNMLKISANDGIEHVVDINPRKAGRFVPGTGQTIVPPEQVRDYRPDIVVVMNREYTGEIQAMLDSMRLRCRLLTVSSQPT